MLLGVHLIARNEADVLERCLQSVKAFADEIIVVDTGSTDETTEIALRLGARLLHFAWQDDFAKARNEALLHARTLWVLVLDADEWVAEPAHTGLRLREELKRTASAALRLRMEHQLDAEEAGNRLVNDAVRVFRADRGFLYAGEIHEQLVRPAGSGSHAGRMADVDGPVSESGLTIKHDGYMPAVMERKAKAERNLRIIARQLSRRPDDPFCLYNYGVTMCQLGRVEEAGEAFGHSLHEVGAEAPYRPTLVRDYVKVLLVLQRAEEACALLQTEAERYSDYADLQLLQGESLRAIGLLQEARLSYEAAIAAGESGGSYISEAGAGSVLARSALAEVLLALGQTEQAQSLFEQVLMERPLWEAASYGLAESLQLRGISDTAIHEQLTLAIGNRQAGDVLLARSLTRIGAFGAALPIWRRLAAASRDKRWLLQDIKLYADTLIGTGQYTGAGDLLLHDLSLRSLGENASQLRETAADIALCYWNEGRMLTDEEADRLSQVMKLDDRRGWLRAIEAAALCASCQVGNWKAWLAREQEFFCAKELLERAVSLGMLRLAWRLAETDARLQLFFEHALYDQGYRDAAAEWMLRRFSAEGELGSGHWFRLGELLYNKSLYSEALGMFERGASAGSAADGDAADRSQLGAAAASLQLALEALQLSGAQGSRAWDGSWAESDAARLLEALKRLDALGWKTKWNGLQRRRAHGGPAEAHFLMHDR